MGVVNIILVLVMVAAAVVGVQSDIATDYNLAKVTDDCFEVYLTRTEQHPNTTCGETIQLSMCFARVSYANRAISDGEVEHFRLLVLFYINNPAPDCTADLRTTLRLLYTVQFGEIADLMNHFNATSTLFPMTTTSFGGEAQERCVEDLLSASLTAGLSCPISVDFLTCIILKGRLALTDLTDHDRFELEVEITIILERLGLICLIDIKIIISGMTTLGVTTTTGITMSATTPETQIPSTDYNLVKTLYDCFQVYLKRTLQLSDVACGEKIKLAICFARVSYANKSVSDDDVGSFRQLTEFYINIPTPNCTTDLRTTLRLLYTAQFGEIADLMKNFSSTRTPSHVTTTPSGGEARERCVNDSISASLSTRLSCPVLIDLMTCIVWEEQLDLTGLTDNDHLQLDVQITIILDRLGLNCSIDINIIINGLTTTTTTTSMSSSSRSTAQTTTPLITTTTTTTTGITPSQDETVTAAP